MNTNNRKLKLESEGASSLFLAYPLEVIDCGTDYSPSSIGFDRLIKALPSKLNLVVMTKTAEIASKVEKMRKKRTTTLVNSELSSIWLRDTAGFNLGSHIVKPVFKPRYYRKFFEEAAIIDSYNKIIHSILGVDMETLPLIWDGGNLVTNGKVGFITDQILSDNKKTHSEDQVKDIIRTSLGIEPVFLPTFPDDPFAHTDGYMNFLDRDTLAFSSYPSKWRKKELSYLTEIRTIARRHVKTVIDLKENPVEEMHGNVYSAKGLYINFLKMGNLIFVPSYQDKETEDHNFSLLKKFGKVIPIDCTELAAFGGLLHCISFTS